MHELLCSTQRGTFLVATRQRQAKPTAERQGVCGRATMLRVVGDQYDMDDGEICLGPDAWQRSPVLGGGAQECGILSQLVKSRQDMDGLASVRDASVLGRLAQQWAMVFWSARWCIGCVGRGWCVCVCVRVSYVGARRNRRVFKTAVSCATAVSTARKKRFLRCGGLQYCKLLSRAWGSQESSAALYSTYCSTEVLLYGKAP